MNNMAQQDTKRLSQIEINGRRLGESTADKNKVD